MSDIFRDPSEGANARRLDLLRRRRDELITMPHAVRRVFVDRSARIAASLVVCVGGLALLAATVIAPVNHALERVLPGMHPAPLSQILLGTWIVALFAYAIARSRGEHRFIVAMSKYVLPGEDVAHDIERLSHEHPDAMAKAMAQRLEARSAAWPVIAAAFLLPATAGYVIDSIMVRGWSRMYEEHLAAQGPAIAGIAALGIVAGLVMTRRFARVPVVAPIAFGVAVLLGVALPFATTMFGVAPLWLLAAGFIAFAIAIVVWRLRSERARIDAVDPAAGSELFSLRDALAMARTFFAKVRAKLTRAVVIPVAAIAVLLAFGGTSLRASTSSAPAPVVASVPHVQPSPTPVVAVEPAPVVPVRQTTAPVQLINGRGNVKGIAGFDTLPEGWTMTVVVRVEDAQGLLAINPLSGSAAYSYEGGAMVTKIEIDACRGAVPLGLQIEPQGSWKPGSDEISLHIEPKLAYDCRPTEK